MHPLFKSRKGLLAYCVAWIPLGFAYRLPLSAASRLTFSESVAVSAVLTCLLTVECLSPWYTCRLLLPLKQERSFWRPVLGHLFIAVWVSAILSGLLSLIVAGLNWHFHRLRYRFAPAIPAAAILVFLTYLLSVALHYLYLALESSRRSELLSREAQLKALKAQINPHFLFNSLNSISALTTVDPARAREMCIRLSDFLRTSLRLGECATVPLREELALTRTYLDVERVRFGDRLRITQAFDHDCECCEVPSLLVQPLIENAIKHGIATLVEGGEIGLSGNRFANQVRFAIENPFDPDSPVPEKNGFGLINVRGRLEARYGSAAALDIDVSGNRYRVTVTLPYETTRKPGA